MRLVAYLFLHKYGIESPFYEDPTNMPTIKRVLPYVLHDCADNTVDYEIRDSALSVLKKIVIHNAPVRDAVAASPDCIKRLIFILTTRVGRLDARDDAVAILKALLSTSAKAKETFHKYSRELVVLSAHNEYVEHHILLGGLLNPTAESELK